MIPGSLRALLLASLLLAAPASASSPGLPATWKEQGLEDLDGMVWFRETCPSTRRPASPPPGTTWACSSVLPSTGATRSTRADGCSGAPAAGPPRCRSRFPRSSACPGTRSGSDGTLSLALRVRRIDWASDLDPEAGPVGDTLTLGSHQALQDRIRVAWTGHLLSELPLLVLAALFVAAALYHLLLFSRRRKQIEHLWFGLLSLAFSVNTFASTYWIYELTASRGLAMRTSDLTGHLAAALAIQFLWHFFSRPIRPAAPRLSALPRRAGRASSGCGRASGRSSPARRSAGCGSCRCWSLAAVLIARETRRGDSGGAEDRRRRTGDDRRPGPGAGAADPPPAWSPFSLAAFGFAAVLVAMGMRPLRPLPPRPRRARPAAPPPGGAGAGPHPRAGGGHGPGPRGEPRQERVPRQHQPRDPHPDERRHRHGRAAGRARPSTPSRRSTCRPSRSAARLSWR